MAGEPHTQYLYAYISNDMAAQGDFEKQHEYIWGWDPESALEEVLTYQQPESGAYLVEILDMHTEGRPVLARYDPHEIYSCKTDNEVN